MGWKERIAALLGISAYAAPTSDDPSLDSAEVERLRRLFGGQLTSFITSQTRWYLDDVESAVHAADGGWLAGAARLWRAAQSDGYVAGVLSTRTGGLVRLPKRFRGRADIVSVLELGTDQARSVFDEMCPATELAQLAADGIGVGVGVGELVPVAGREYPLFVRHDPEFLVYRWDQNRWYFRSLAGLLPITPGDGRWVLHVPGGRVAPWQHALWRAVGKAWIRKDHASLNKDAWEQKLANPARVAVAPHGASEAQKQSWWRKVMAWGVNTVFGVTPGYDVKLLESNGRGYESFEKTIAASNTEIIVALAGQTVTVDGGTGFANADVHKSIRADLIKETADALAYTVNTQILPPYIAARWGEDAIVDGAVVEWDVTPPKDATSGATVLSSVAGAITALTSALAPYGKAPDVDGICAQFGVKVIDLPANSAPAAAATATATDERPRLELVRSAA